jgi:hypothetical protein
VISKARRLILVALLLAAPLAAGKKPALPSAEELIDRAEAAIEAGSVDPPRDLAPLVERLRTTRIEDEQDSLVRSIATMGRHDGRSPASVKAYLSEAAPAALLAVARGKSDPQIRADALMALRSLNVDDATLDEGIAIGAASTDHAVQFSGRLLGDWKASRPARQALKVEATPEAAAREQRALAVIEAHHSMVSGYSLGRAAADADTELVEALLDAGVDVNAPLPAGSTPLAEAAGSGCVSVERHPPLADRLATIDLLIARGAEVKRLDNGGNTLLVGAVHCPLPVMEKLLAAGASAKTVGDTGFGPLQFALANGKWDLAELLVNHGARMSQKSVDELFFEKPDDPAKLALLKKATAK